MSTTEDLVRVYRKFVADLVDVTDYACSPHKKDVVAQLVYAIENDSLDKEALVEFLTATRFTQHVHDFSVSKSATS
jgi:hypothetical protein